MSRLVVSITHGKDDSLQASLGFVMANSGLAGGVETVVFLSTEGAYLSQNGYADDVHEDQFPALSKLIKSFVGGGGTLWVCGSCFRKRDLSEEELVSTAKIVGGATLIEFMSKGASCLSY